MQYAINNGGNFIIWLNDDCLIEKESLENLVDFTRRHPNSIIGGIGYESSEIARVAFGGKRRKMFGYEVIKPTQHRIYPCDLLSGNFVCMPTTVVHQIGYPDVEKTPHYGGDSLFLIRARRAGYSFFFDSRWPATNLSTAEKSSTNPSNWLTGNKSTVEIAKLIFNRHSLMSWRVWWNLYKEDYQHYGIILFLLKFSYMTVLLGCITTLRWLPVRARIKISLLKRGIFAD